MLSASGFRSDSEDRMVDGSNWVDLYMVILSVFSMLFFPTQAFKRLLVPYCGCFNTTVY